MSFNRPIRGGCHCGRNLYMIQLPSDQPATQTAQIMFHSHPSHRSTLGTPLPAYLRVPLQYYRAAAVPVRADETNAMIHRAYEPRGTAGEGGDEDEEDAVGGHTKRYFCGFCGTPLSFWSESPPAEADFICLTLGSLWPEDLADLEELGLLAGVGLRRSPSPAGSGSGSSALYAPERGGGGAAAAAAAGTRSREGEGVVGSVGVLSWLDTLTEGSRLGEALRQTRGGAAGPKGRVRIEWEIVEWSGDDDAGGGESPRKRKADEVEGADEGGRMEGIA
ncbi:uncharacterized protein B0H64DRAFT_165329 [Chaetomium fimeti]|uniref:CENP-V/GFA domain-containing protein n=1 Tax=Chaetomium fimeti TaxID=1854472 RepID=A0AAE0HGM1_9PEZI|nr:hypothetical protein B0H64DRAFT_165329 [Chaetomium fimeti]